MSALKAATILCWNQGSSSVKFAVYRVIHAQRHTVEERAVQGGAHCTPAGDGEFWIEDKAGNLLAREAFHCDSPARELVRAIEEGLLPHPDVIGHRVVHGGLHLDTPCMVDDSVIATLRNAIPFAPLHLPPEIEAIEKFAKYFPRARHVACFDTSFHCAMPEIARMFALPRRYFEQGLRRYGFHGLSYEYVASVLGPALGAKAVIAHLGSGASMAAVLNGKPVDTTTGLTPTGGLMMSTRTGDLDPGLLLYLLRHGDHTAEQLDQVVNKESGMFGVSGITADMRTLLEQRSRNAGAAAAVELFCNSARKNLAAMAASLGGLNTLVFTGGIGERSDVVRQEICRGLSFLNIQLDSESNSRHAPVISAPSSPCIVRIVPTNEELMIARHAFSVASKG